MGYLNISIFPFHQFRACTLLFRFLNVSLKHNLIGVSVVSLDKALELNQVSARVGDNIEIKCDVTGSPTPPIVWRRHGLDLAQLAEDELKVFPDGALYINNVRLIHAGNYTCHAQRNKDVVQTHVLHVHSKSRLPISFFPFFRGFPNGLLYVASLPSQKLPSFLPSPPIPDTQREKAKSRVNRDGIVIVVVALIVLYPPKRRGHRHNGREGHWSDGVLDCFRNDWIRSAVDAVRETEKKSCNKV